MMGTARDLDHWSRGGVTTVRGIAPTGDPLVGPDRAFGGLHFSDKSFWKAAQSVGSPLLFADASTRHVADTVSADVLKRLATINGGEEIPTDW
jgi:hypothetical protein